MGYILRYKVFFFVAKCRPECQVLLRSFVLSFSKNIFIFNKKLIFKFD